MTDGGGRFVVISGGSGGLGSAAVQAFAGHGYTVFSLDARKSDAHSPGVIEVETDITDARSVENALLQVMAYTDRLAAVISLAGIYCMDSLIEVPEDRLKRMLDVNVLGVYRLNKAFLPLLRRDGGRVIVVTSELAGMKALPFNGIYSLTKTALQHYTDSLRQELALLGVRVIEIMPGAFGTGMIEASFAALDRMSENTALYRTNTRRFRQVMRTQSGTAKPPDELAKTIFRAATVRRPRLKYRPHNNLLLQLFDLLPLRLQVLLIGWLIKGR